MHIFPVFSFLFILLFKSIFNKYFLIHQRKITKKKGESTPNAEIYSIKLVGHPLPGSMSRDLKGFY